MEVRKFLDPNGSIILAVSSSLPGLTIVPPGKTAEDGVVMTEHEFKDHLDKIERELLANPPVSQLDILTKQVKDLQTDVQKIKDKQK